MNYCILLLFYIFAYANQFPLTKFVKDQTYNPIKQ